MMMMMMMMMPMLIVADVRSFTTAVFFPQLSSEHAAADVCAAATHCSWSCIHTVSSVGQRSAVAPTS